MKIDVERLSAMALPADKSFLQRAAGFLSRQAFLAAAAPFCGPSDASAAWIRRFAHAARAKNPKKGFFSDWDKRQENTDVFPDIGNS